jgi:hypothetical protein
MPWTNLELQRKRLNELQEILGKNVLLSQVSIKNHRHFRILVKTPFDRELIALQRGRFLIYSIRMCDFETTEIFVCAPSDHEKYEDYHENETNIWIDIDMSKDKPEYHCHEHSY